ncbi:MAG: hypothetical protein LBS21_01320 [Clostridiales bacterium]|nr:hypothetical protein [Clostridiales bacterium]
MEKEKFISKQKLSKKARREIDLQGRRTWGNVNPSTKKIESKKAYNRKKARKEYKYFSGGSFLLPIFINSHH